MPRLWNDTIEAHQQAVHDAVLDATAGLVETGGLAAVSMSAIASATGIGRATLYRYFPDIDAIMEAWHARQVTTHLEALSQIAAKTADAGERLRAVLEVYCRQNFNRPRHASVPRLHGGPHMQHAHRHLQSFVAELIGAAQQAGYARADLPAAELAAFALAALAAAATQTNKAAIGRLVTLVLDALQPGRKSSRA
jgi:AcrR family transcriptional regulator